MKKEKKRKYKLKFLKTLPDEENSILVELSEYDEKKEPDQTSEENIKRNKSSQITNFDEPC